MSQRVTEERGQKTTGIPKGMLLAVAVVVLAGLIYALQASMHDGGSGSGVAVAPPSVTDAFAAFATKEVNLTGPYPDYRSGSVAKDNPTLFKLKVHNRSEGGVYVQCEAPCTLVGPNGQEHNLTPTGEGVRYGFAIGGEPDSNGVRVFEVKVINRRADDGDLIVYFYLYNGT